MGTRTISLEFGADKALYLFPQEVLTHHFRYFETALQMKSNQATFIEGLTCHFHLQEITARGFARLYKTIVINFPESHYEHCDNIDHTLEAIVAADYLGFVAFENYDSLLFPGFISVALMRDRTKLTTAHLQLVASHPAFKSKYIWKVFAKAGVRPCMQAFMLEDNKQSRECLADGHSLMSRPQPGHKDPEVWRSIIRHYRDLRKNSTGYAAEVLEQVSATLGHGLSNEEGDDAAKTKLGYRDPLFHDVFNFSRVGDKFTDANLSFFTI